MLVPQAMAYAMLAGLPPVVGLYASTVPLLAYACLGTSRQLAVGPVAIVSLLVADACVGPAGTVADVATITGRAAALALLVGAIQIALGLCVRVFLLNFVSHAVVSGVYLRRRHYDRPQPVWAPAGSSCRAETPCWRAALDVMRNLSDTHLPTLAIGLGAVAIQLLARFKRWRFPVTLPIIAAILLVWTFNLEAYGVRAVGKVSSGLPAWRLPDMLLEWHPAPAAFGMDDCLCRHDGVHRGGEVDRHLREISHRRQP